MHADHHAIVSHPSYDSVANRCVFFGNDGGIFKAADVKAVGTEAQPPFVHGWTELNNNYGVTQFYGGAVHAASGRVVGGAQDNGTIGLAPGPTANTGAAGSAATGAGVLRIRRTPRSFMASTSTSTSIATPTAPAPQTRRATDTSVASSGTRHEKDWNWKSVPFQIPDARTQDALFIAPFVLDSKRPQRLLAGGLSLWETNDAKSPNTPTSGPRWRAIKSSTGRLITAIAMSPASSDVVWVGHEDGAVFSTGNGASGAPAWKRCDHVGSKPLTPTRYCTRIVASPTDARVATSHLAVS